MVFCHFFHEFEEKKFCKHKKMWENNCSKKKMWNCNKTIKFDLPIKGNVSIVSDLQSFYFQWSFFLAIIKHCLFSIMWTSSKNMLPNRNKHKIKSRTEYVSMWNLHAHFRQKWRIKCKLITFQMENESNSFFCVGVYNVFLVVFFLFVVVDSTKSPKAIEQFPIGI